MHISDMSNKRLGVARAHLHELLDALETPVNRVEFLQRVQLGKIAFSYSWIPTDEDGEKLPVKPCGCIGGSYVIIKYGLEDEDDDFVIERLEEDLPRFRGDVLESISYQINFDANPGNNANSKWLLDETIAYLQELREL